MPGQLPELSGNLVDRSSSSALLFSAKARTSLWPDARREEQEVSCFFLDRACLRMATPRLFKYGLSIASIFSV